MRTISYLSLPLLAFVFLFLSGCSGDGKDKPKDDKEVNADKKTDKQDEAASVRANVEKLKPEDRKLAEEQHFCAVEPDHLLGSMGVPVKVMIKGQPVILCCDACEIKAKAHADRTLAKVQQLKAQRAETPNK